MLMTLSGCDSDNKAVLEAADEYAKAVTSFNHEDIADLMDDGKEMAGDYSMYGGCYFKENTVIFAMCYTDYVNEHEKIDVYLKNAGLPRHIDRQIEQTAKPLFRGFLTLLHYLSSSFLHFKDSARMMLPSKDMSGFSIYSSAQNTPSSSTCKVAEYISLE